VHFCPRQAILLSEEFNSKGVNIPVPAHMEKCTGCRMCELYCPDFAIAIREASQPPDAGPAMIGPKERRRKEKERKRGSLWQGRE
jgi:NAD-dependent dihydropyrimidine dehydrogenase PreA subunit